MTREMAVVAGATGTLGSAISAALRERGLAVLGLARHGSDREDLIVEGSRIVAVTGHLGYDPVPASVSAGVANAALAALVRQLARALGPRGVTCHAVAPGPVESPRVDRLIEHLATASGTSPEDARAKLLEEGSVGRFATPEDVAWAVSLLLDDAAAVMNGSTIFLDGGRRTAIP